MAMELSDFSRFAFGYAPVCCSIGRLFGWSFHPWAKARGPQRRWIVLAEIRTRAQPASGFWTELRSHATNHGMWCVECFCGVGCVVAGSIRFSAADSTWSSRTDVRLIPPAIHERCSFS